MASRRRWRPCPGATRLARSLADITAMLGSVGFEPLARRPMFVLMNYPVDSASRLHRLCWKTLVLAMAAWNPLGAVAAPRCIRSSSCWSLA